ncbi:MAG: hypothetical protein BGO80_13330 [Devosia sp. 63-57]|nr:MAG: hypothetical protein ABS74_16520 [Pelagibacterium sp. SCN 63-126]ODU87252.1 MAG: hypothetical protein ABT14_05820 [Pelagibacterium sp. SCN 63-17]OJX42464.1 MAG: hypothetical protein BGO80_13330 [Devosia sp. 63-57]
MGQLLRQAKGLAVDETMPAAPTLVAGETFRQRTGMAAMGQDFSEMRRPIIEIDEEVGPCSGQLAHETQDAGTSSQRRAS